MLYYNVILLILILVSTVKEFVIHNNEDVNKPLAVFLMGPTATGKTGLAIDCVENLPLEIISVDSTMVYRGLDIGSAKPDAVTLSRAPHRLINICEPTDPYSAGRFCDDALSEMASIVSSGKIPFLVGGTMLYFNTLINGMADLPDADPEVRRRLDEEAARIGWPAMHQRLAQIDPEAAGRLHPNDPQRIQRALEVYEITGKTLTSLWQDQKAKPFPFRVLKIALMPPDRTQLRSTIEQRFDAMLVEGLVEEVRRLYEKRTLSAQLPSMRSVGYRQVWSYLEGEYDYATMRDKAVTATAQLAKRQMTWLRSEKDCNYLDPGEIDGPKLLKNLKILLS